MKKTCLAFIFSIILTGFNSANAQSLSLEETKKILCSHKWFLRRFEQDGKMFTVPKEMQGLRRVFNLNGTVYEFMPGEKEADAERLKYTITKTTMTIIEAEGETTYKYRLEDFIGYKLYLTAEDEEDEPTLVFEQREKNENQASAETGYNSGIDAVVIGNQTWMKKNLDAGRFCNGDQIPQATSAEEWKTAKEKKISAWCYVDFDEGNAGKYGKLYNWYCVADKRGLAPEGWHVPTLEEARQLIRSAGGESVAADALRSITGWKDNSRSTNKSGFNAYGAGKCWLDGSFLEKDFTGYFATTAKSNVDAQGKFNVHYFSMQQGSGTVYNNHLTFPGVGLSVRCVKN
ncbi:MAG TPA: fibrobacter succinogenes major paralogous domain-containing protein [Ferruginibacter sp.]|nr:fibrobacter succinogenes major paralogous domain-containing protein [Ferruginibacter sp.]